MCVLKVIVLLALALVSATELHGVTSEGNFMDASISGITFEIIITKLEYLQTRLGELESWLKINDQHISTNIHKQKLELRQIGSQVRSNHRSMDEKLYEVNSSISQMVTFIGQNITAIQALLNKTEQTLDKHENLQEYTPKKEVAQLKANLEECQRNNSFSSCKANPSKESGHLCIQLSSCDKPFLAYCDQTTFGGGWLVIQYRFNGSENFHRDWVDYRNGFGSVHGEFWLGLEYLYRLTSTRSHELLVELKDYDGNYVYARYSEFRIESEQMRYRLQSLGSYTGTAGNSFTGKGFRFTTRDRDQDYHQKNCADICHGAWWHAQCTDANLNGRYENYNNGQTMYWFAYKKDNRGMAYSRMSIREI